jgi:hypothetical protein
MLNTNWQGYRIAAWMGQALLAIAILLSLVQTKWMNALSLSAFFIAALIFLVKADRLPALFDFLFVIAALLNAGGWVGGWFYAPVPTTKLLTLLPRLPVSVELFGLPSNADRISSTYLALLIYHY